MKQHSQETKNKIKESINATRKRHKNMDCKVYELKVVENKLPKSKKETLTRFFLEAKWMKNHILSGDIAQATPLMKTADVKLPNGSFETRELKALGSHMRQSILSGIKGDLKSLKETKNKGRKVGKLKFCKEVKSIDLKEYGNTYKVDRSSQKVKIQKLGWVRVRGFDNIPEDVDFSNAKLLSKPDGYYINVTTYINKGDSPHREFIPGSVIGLDFGLSTAITTSEGEHINLYVEESDRLKRLQKKKARQVKGSNNYKKTCSLIQKEYQKMGNKKRDMAYKFVSDLSHYENVFFQDEMISSWKRKNGFARGGKKIQKGILGRVKSLLKTKDWTTMLSRGDSTTQTCVCGAKNKHQLDERTYFCGQCGYSDNRDVHAAKNMIRFGLSDKRYNTPQGLGEAPVEDITSVLHFNYLKGSISYCPLKQETYLLQVSGDTHSSSVSG